MSESKPVVFLDIDGVLRLETPRFVAMMDVTISST